MSAILLLPRRQLTLTAEGSGKVVGVFGVDANAVKGVRKLVRASIRTGQLQFPRSLNRTPADKIFLRYGACRAPCQGLAGVSVFGTSVSSTLVLRPFQIIFLAERNWSASP